MSELVLERWPSSQPIYHYTTPQGLLGIVQSHSIWASEAAGLNELDEIHKGWDEIENYLETNQEETSAWSYANQLEWRTVFLRQSSSLVRQATRTMRRNGTDTPRRDLAMRSNLMLQ